MAVPKHRMSKMKSRKRRTHYIATVPTVVHCTQCNEPVMAHHACPSCGTYRGRQVLKMEEA